MVMPAAVDAAETAVVSVKILSAWLVAASMATRLP
jgi:hypothetical protein